MLLVLLACTSPPTALDANVHPTTAGLGATEVKLTLSTGRTDDQLGNAIGHGDFDGDGYGDVIAGAWWKDSSDLVHQNIGAAVAWYGAAAGLAREQVLTASDATDWDYYGNAVAGVGDVDGDGYDDVLVGNYADDDRGSATGSAWLYPGGPSGIDGAAGEKLLASDTAGGDFFGSSVTPVGDVDGDGYPDVAIGALGDDDRGTEAGAVWIYPGGPSGLDLTRGTKLTASDGSTWACFGWGVTAGDFDGDGYGDVVVGAYGDAGYAGAAYVYYGSAGGILASTERKLVASDGLAGAMFGLSLVGVGDLDGDGSDELVVGAPYQDGSGAVYLYYGTTGGFERETALLPRSGAALAGYGWSVGVGGDLDGDGLVEVVAGAHLTDREAGRVFVFRGDGPGFAPGEALAAGDSAAHSWYGYAAAGVGDVNGDGVDDLVVGAPYDNERGATAGAIYAYMGACTDGDADGVCASADCDDADPTSHPGAQEVCGGGDEDCDGLVDDADGTVDRSAFVAAWADDDGDGYGDPDVDASGCAPGAGTASNPDDCDDTRADVSPAGAEVCDAADADEDCDGLADDDDADTTGATTAHLDEDGDRYGGAAVTACEPPPGAVTDGRDCDDTDATVHPGAPEVPDDGVDQDCSGADEAGAVEEKPGACGCGTGGAPSAGLAAVALGIAALRSRRRGAR